MTKIVTAHSTSLDGCIAGADDRPELYHTDDPELVRARDAARALLYPPAAEAANSPDDGGDVRAGVAAWSLVHGLATLWLNHNLPPPAGRRPPADHPRRRPLPLLSCCLEPQVARRSMETTTPCERTLSCVPIHPP